MWYDLATAFWTNGWIKNNYLQKKNVKGLIRYIYHKQWIINILQKEL